MIDPRGEGPGALLPLFERRQQLWEKLVAATINAAPKHMELRVDGSVGVQQSNVVNNFPRMRVSDLLITCGQVTLLALKIGTRASGGVVFQSGHSFMFSFPPSFATLSFPFPVVLESGIDISFLTNGVFGPTPLNVRFFGYAE